MAFDPITAVFNFLNTGLAKVLPDGNIRAQAAMELASQFNAEIMGQIQLNLKEAESNDKFVTRWRPAIGWVCVLAYTYTFVLQPFLVFLIIVSGIALDATKLPKLDWTELSIVLFGMLGISASRSYEKVKGVTN